MIKTYMIDEEQHDALIRAARHGKNNIALNELERVMCECAEIDLDRVTKSLHHSKKVFVSFPDAELKTPALEKAFTLFCVDNSLDELLILCAKNFPKFEKEIEVKTEVSGSYYVFDE